MKGGVGCEGSTLVKDKIVERVAFSMADGTWHPFRSVRALAAELGITLGVAQKYSAEASRLLRLSWGGEEAKAAVLERIAQIGRAAESRTEEAGVFNAETKCVEVVELKKPDMRTALGAAKHLADMLGLSGTNSEIVIRYQQMSDGDLYREVQRFAQQLTGKSSNNDGIETTGESIDEPDEDQAALDRIGASGE